MDLDEFFSGFAGSRPIFEALENCIEELGPVNLRITKSQVAFYHRKAFAWAWIPARYLPGAAAPLY
jgi:hypothetical protein